MSSMERLFTEDLRHIAATLLLLKIGRDVLAPADVNPVSGALRV